VKISRRTIALALAGTMIAVASLAAAASVTLNVNSFAGGQDAVAACTADITVSHTAAYNATTGKYDIDVVTLTAADNGCDGLTAFVTVASAANASLAAQSAVFTGDTAAVDFSADHVAVDTFDHVALYVTQP
jgi:ABC-type glycerol-3-phosphate transport system substrate-binding protein